MPIKSMKQSRFIDTNKSKTPINIKINISKIRIDWSIEGTLLQEM